MREYISKEDQKRFIRLVCKHPSLYDPSEKNSDMESTKSVWMKITAEMNLPTMSVADWKCKWKCLRDTFVKKRKEVRSAENQETTDKVMSWRFYNDLSFLEPFVDRSYHRRRLPKSNGLEYQHYTIIKNEDYAESGEENTEEYSTISYSNDNPEDGFSREVERGKRKRKATPIIDNDLDGSNISSALDETDSWSGEGSHSQGFFQSCAFRMDKLPERVQSYLQLQISQLFFNAENPDVPPVSIMPLPSSSSSSSSVKSPPSSTS